MKTEGYKINGKLYNSDQFLAMTISPDDEVIVLIARTEEIEPDGYVSETLKESYSLEEVKNYLPNADLKAFWLSPPPVDVTELVKAAREAKNNILNINTEIDKYWNSEKKIRLYCKTNQYRTTAVC